MASSLTFRAVVDGLLAEGWQVRFRAAGRSMLPTVRDGECLTVAPVDPRDVAAGDVVLCETWRGHLAHRVLSVERARDGAPRFTMRGDAATESDRPVTAGAVRGRVVSVERDGRARGLAFPGGALGRLVHDARLRSRPTLRALRGWLAGPVSVTR